MTAIKAIDGLPVIDATHPLTIHVSRQDIRGSDPKRPDACAVARACKRELHCMDVRVHLSRIYIRANKTNWQRYIVPNSMRDEIVAFDRGGTFEPGAFVINPAYPSICLGVKHAPGPKKRPRQQTRQNHKLVNVRPGPA